MSKSDQRNASAGSGKRKNWTGAHVDIYNELFPDMPPRKFEPSKLDIARDLMRFTAEVGVAIPAVVAIEGGIRVAHAVRRWKNYRPPRTAMLPCPEPKEIQAGWEQWRSKRKPLEALVFGAKMLNVSQYVDCSYKHDKYGRIISRATGLKGWMREQCPDISYASAIGYRKLAEVTCRAIKLPEYIPLEWVLPGTEKLDLTRDLNPAKKLSIKFKKREMLQHISRCRQKLTELLEGATSVNQFYAALDAITGERRHRPSIRSTGQQSGRNAARNLRRQLHNALDNLQSLQAEDSFMDERESILNLLEELMHKIENVGS